MEMIIHEIQFTCLLLMGVATLLLFVILPRHISGDRILNTSRKLLAVSTLLMTIHFAIQYLFHHHPEDITEQRTVTNLMFSIPVSHFIFLSYYYLQRKGNIPKTANWFAPTLFLIQVCILIVDDLFPYNPTIQSITFPALSFLFGLMLIFCFIQLTKQYYIIRQEIRQKSDLSLYPLQKWTCYSMLIMMLVFLIFPFMTYCENYTIRSIYGLIFIIVTFFYIYSFIGYCFNHRCDPVTAETLKKLPTRQHGIWIAHELRFKKHASPSLKGIALYNLSTEQPPMGMEILGAGFSMQLQEESPNLQHALTEDRLQQVKTRLDHFIESEDYTKPHLKKKDVAMKIGITVNELDIWLGTTEFPRFNNWITHLRIAKAKHLILSCPNLTHDEVAERCGFCNRQYFQLQFSQFEGVSPSKWMKEHNAPGIS